MPGARQVFIDHVRGRLGEALPRFTSPESLFSATNPLYAEFMALYAHDVGHASRSLTHFVVGIVEAEARWEPNGELEQCLNQACGDIVQAIQAVKESLLNASSEVTKQELLRTNLTNLANALRKCEEYCVAVGLAYPFTRAQLQVEDSIALLFPDYSDQLGFAPPLPVAELAVSINPAIAGPLEYVQLGSLRAPRLLNGLWQMSSPAWGCASGVKQTIALSQLAEAGLLACDMADHYGDAELIYGSFRSRLRPDVRAQTLAASKWCVFQSVPEPITAELVLNAVQERARRLKGKIDLLQFHWNNYEDRNYLIVLAELVKLTKTCPTLVSHIGLCNFDAEHTEAVCQYLLAEIGEVGIVSNQVQFSLIDSRPLLKMVPVCERYGIKLLTYGTFVSFMFY
ncbi:hypothetical protein PQX77_001546 [Marasmius sp. AFHP31]|nr:hypothetical protein PQX77_001546 [Marasmius sp. AFHP31]